MPVSPLPQGGTAQCQKRPSRPMTSPTKTRENVNEHLASQAMQDAAKDIDSFLAQSSILGCIAQPGLGVAGGGWRTRARPLRDPLQGMQYY